MKRLWAKIKWLVFWGFMLCLIFGPFIGWNNEAHAIGQVAGHAGQLIAAIWDATFGKVLGTHGVSVRTH